MKFALPAILLLAAFFRLFHLTTIPPPLYFDEAMNGNDAMQNIEEGRLLPFYPQNGGREGLYINLETALIYFFGPQAWLLRLPAALFGILTVWGIYLLCGASPLALPPGFRPAMPAVALLAAFFTAAGFWHIMFSRIGLRAIGAPLFAVWALYLLLASIHRAREARPFLTQSIAGGILFGLGFYTYIAYRITPLLVIATLAHFLYEGRRKPWLRSLLRIASAYLAAAFIVSLPLALYFIRHPEALTHRSAEISIFNAPHPATELLSNMWKTTQMIFTRGDFDWQHNIAYRPVVFWPVAILFALGVAFAARGLRHRETRFAPALFLAWLVLGAVPAVLSDENMPSSLRSIMMIPPVYALAALGAWNVSRHIPKRAALAAAAVLVAAVVFDAWHSYFDVWATNPNVPIAYDAAGVDIANRILALPLTAPKYVVPVTPGAPPGVPAPTQTVMFLTQSYTEKQRRETNIHYILRQATDTEDGIDFCRKVALQYRENVFCLQVNRKIPPKF